ncbi:MAG: hypothetical protein IID30_12500 [Planctomycetes bacterium]|nr:hypothetical protein [Planctomycetota bacterium]MCH7602673.1 hypothetical protein [Planctomycetota bacterium]
MLILSSTNQVAFPEILLQMLMLVAVVAIGLLLTISIRGKIAKRNAAIPEPRERIAQARIKRFTGEDKHTISAHLHDTARRLSVQMDNKAERLEQLLEEADRKLHDLQLVMRDLTNYAGSSATIESVAPRLPAPRTPPVPSPPPATSPPPAQPALKIPATPSSPEVFPTISPASHPLPNEPDPLTRSVYELSDSGQDTVSIARELDEQIGKVELILALRAG